MFFSTSESFIYLAILGNFGVYFATIVLDRLLLGLLNSIESFSAIEEGLVRLKDIKFN